MGQNLLDFWRQDPVLFERAFASAPIMLMAVSSEGVIDMATPFLASKLGTTVEGLVGASWTSFLPKHEGRTTGQDSAGRLLTQLFAAGELRNEDYELCDLSGARVPLLISALVDDKADAEARRGLFLLIDNAERKRAQDAQRQVDRMEAIGQLVGGVAHDYNNLLTAVQGNLELLLEEGAQGDQHVLASEALQATRRASDVTQQLLCFGRRATLCPEPIDLRATIEAQVPDLRRHLGHDLGLSIDVAAGLYSVILDTARFRSVLLSIVDNAQDAMAPGDTLFVTADNMWLPAEEAMLRPGAWTPGPYVTLSFRDTGQGMTPDVLSRVFEPYFTTKARAQRSGLGMAMVDGFVKQSGGAVEVSSHPGLGTTVTLYFPADAHSDVLTVQRRMEPTTGLSDQ